MTIPVLGITPAPTTADNMTRLEGAAAVLATTTPGALEGAGPSPTATGAPGLTPPAAAPVPPPPAAAPDDKEALEQVRRSNVEAELRVSRKTIREQKDQIALLTKERDELKASPRGSIADLVKDRMRSSGQDLERVLGAVIDEIAGTPQQASPAAAMSEVEKLRAEIAERDRRAAEQERRQKEEAQVRGWQDRVVSELKASPAMYPILSRDLESRVRTEALRLASLAIDANGVAPQIGEVLQALEEHKREEVERLTGRPALGSPPPAASPRGPSLSNADASMGAAPVNYSALSRDERLKGVAELLSGRA